MVWTTIIVLFYAVLIYAFIRNERVYRYRLGLLDRISEQCDKDIYERRVDFRWRFDELREVTYNQMLLSLKPLDSFYKRDPARPEQ